jgi:hypothetical protein
MVLQAGDQLIQILINSWFAIRVISPIFVQIIAARAAGL